MGHASLFAVIFLLATPGPNARAKERASAAQQSNAPDLIGAICLDGDLSAYMMPLAGFDISPDGDHLLSGAGVYNGRMMLFDLKSGSHRSVGWGGFTSALSISLPHAVTFSPDGGLLAAAGGVYRTDEVRVFSTTTWKKISSMKIRGARVEAALAFSPGGDLLAVGSGRALHLFRPADGYLVRSLPVDSVDGVSHICFSPDGRNLVVSGKGAKVSAILDSSTGRLIHTLDLNAAIPKNAKAFGIGQARFLPRHNWLIGDVYYRSDAGGSEASVAGALGSRLVVWDTFSWEIVRHIEDFRMPAVSHDSRRIAGLSKKEGGLLVLSVPEFRQVARIGIGGDLYDLKWTPDDSTLVAAIMETTKRLATDKSCMISLEGAKSLILLERWRIPRSIECVRSGSPHWIHFELRRPSEPGLDFRGK